MCRKQLIDEINGYEITRHPQQGKLYLLEKSEKRSFFSRYMGFNATSQKYAFNTKGYHGNQISPCAIVIIAFYRVYFLFTKQAFTDHN